MIKPTRIVARGCRAATTRPTAADGMAVRVWPLCRPIQQRGALPGCSTQGDRNGTQRRRLTAQSLPSNGVISPPDTARGSLVHPGSKVCKKTDGPSMPETIPCCLRAMEVARSEDRYARSALSGCGRDLQVVEADRGSGEGHAPDTGLARRELLGFVVLQLSLLGLVGALPGLGEDADSGP